MKTVWIFYLLVFYVLIQFCWWAYLLVDLNQEVYIQKMELLKQQTTAVEIPETDEQLLIKKLHERFWMIAGEGIVFLGLLLLGISLTWRSFQKEVMLASTQKNFLLSITHEFKSPLAAIKLNMQTLKKHDLNPKQKELMLNNTITETERMHALIENALLAAKIETHNFDVHKEEFNLSDSISKTLNSRYHSLVESGRVKQQVESGIFIKGDEFALSSVLLNLVENAEKYSSEDSLIKIILTQNENEAVLSVMDSGIGVADEDKEKIFHRFYRLGNEETRKSIGTGLGLFIVKHIVDLHKGKILVKNNQPAGTVFEVVLPKNI